mmetsp:Transcript_1304/g.1966  ORF Transcript_1304/g.1966 Transcript_1304/m.1966 type:complete len:228 (-) Transcript_1304:3027-3710(-)
MLDFVKAGGNADSSIQKPKSAGLQKYEAMMRRNKWDSALENKNKSENDSVMEDMAQQYHWKSKTKNVEEETRVDPIENHIEKTRDNSDDQGTLAERLYRAQEEPTEKERYRMMQEQQDKQDHEDLISRAAESEAERMRIEREERDNMNKLMKNFNEKRKMRTVSLDEQQKEVQSMKKLFVKKESNVSDDDTFMFSVKRKQKKDSSKRKRKKKKLNEPKETFGNLFQY